MSGYNQKIRFFGVSRLGVHSFICISLMLLSLAFTLTGTDISVGAGNIVRLCLIIVDAISKKVLRDFKGRS